MAARRWGQPGKGCEELVCLGPSAFLNISIAGTYLHHRVTFRGGAHFFLINPETRREVPHAGWHPAWDAAASSLAPFPPGPGALAAVLSWRRCPRRLQCRVSQPHPGQSLLLTLQGSPCSQVDPSLCRFLGWKSLRGCWDRRRLVTRLPAQHPSSLHLKAACPCHLLQEAWWVSGHPCACGRAVRTHWVALWFGPNARRWLNWRRGL